jgi:NAD-dependent deacetylase
MELEIRRVAEKLRQARRVAVLTGAGVSAESGVPTFRGPQGLWRQYRPEDLATPQAFARDPKLVWEWYDWRRQKVAACEPNAGHRALARLEELVSSFDLVTQNVDGLHRAAGSRSVWELHGTLWDVFCVRCSRRREDRRAPLPEIPPLCACGALERPGVVWFGEALPQETLSRALEASARAEVFLVVGTSSLVYPAASLPAVARDRGGAFLVEINPDPTPLSDSVDVRIAGTSAVVLPRIVDAI